MNFLLDQWGQQDVDLGYERLHVGQHIALCQGFECGLTLQRNLWNQGGNGILEQRDIPVVKQDAQFKAAGHLVWGIRAFWLTNP